MTHATSTLSKTSSSCWPILVATMLRSVTKLDRGQSSHSRTGSNSKDHDWVYPQGSGEARICLLTWADRVGRVWPGLVIVIPLLITLGVMAAVTPPLTHTPAQSESTIAIEPTHLR